MPSDEVKITMSAENAQLVQKWLEAGQGPEHFKRQLEEVAKAGKRTADQLTKQFADAGKSIQGSFHRGAGDTLLDPNAGKVDAAARARTDKQLNDILKVRVAMREGRAEAAYAANGISAYAIQAGNLGTQIGGALSHFSGFGSIVAGLITSATLLKNEYEAMIARQSDFKDRQVNVNDSFRRAQKTLAGDNSLTADSLFEQIVRGSQGGDPAEMFSAFESAMNVAGDVDAKTVLKTVLEAKRQSPELNREQLVQTVSGAIALQKEFKATPAEALAGLQQSSVAAAPEDVGSYAKYIIPSIAKARQYGRGDEKFEQIAPLAIGFGMRMGDTSGRPTGTNFEKLLKHVKEETMAAGLVGKNATIDEMLTAFQNAPEEFRAKQLGVFAAKEWGMEPKEAIARMRKYQKTRGGDFGGELAGEAKAFIPTLELLSPGDNKTKQEVAAARRKVAGLNPDAVKQIEAVNTELAGSQFGRAAEVDRVRRQSENEFRLLNPLVGGRAAQIQLGESMRTSLGHSSLWQKFSSVQDNLLQGDATPKTLRKSASDLNFEAARLYDPQLNPIDAMALPNDEKTRRFQALSPERQNEIRVLEGMALKMDQLASLQEKSQQAAVPERLPLKVGGLDLLRGEPGVRADEPAIAPRANGVRPVPPLGPAGVADENRAPAIAVAPGAAAGGNVEQLLKDNNAALKELAAAIKDGQAKPQQVEVLNMPKPGPPQPQRIPKPNGN